MSETLPLNLDRPRRALSYVTAARWALTPEMLQVVAEVADLSREERFERDVQAILQRAAAAKVARTGFSREVLQGRRGRRMDGTENVTVRDGVAILSINGVISRYADFFSDFSGGTTLESISRDFQAALDNPAVDAILLEIDSPGGDAAGICEFAGQIYAARARKHCVAYVEDTGASAGYWIAAAAEEVVIGPTALVGSIGVRSPVIDTTKADENRGIRRFHIVSDQSPRKAPDPTTPDGEAQIRSYLTATAAVFVADVARYRGVTEEKVLSDFGQGALVVGQAAVDAGMADRLGDFESLLSEMQEQAGEARSPFRKTAANGGSMREGLLERILRTAGWSPPKAENGDEEQRAVTAEVPPSTAQDPVAAENVRLRAALDERDRRDRAAADHRMIAEAGTWADSAVRAGNATPAERPGLVTLYRRAVEADANALTEEQRTALGASLAPLASQVELLKGAVAGRKVPGGSVLTKEVLAPGAPQGFVLPAQSEGDDFAKTVREGAQAWGERANGNGRGGK